MARRVYDTGFIQRKGKELREKKVSKRRERRETFIFVEEYVDKWRLYLSTILM